MILLLVEMMLKFNVFLKVKKEEMKEKRKKRRSVRGKKDDNKGDLICF